MTSDREWLTEELFLNACLPFVRTELRKRIWKVCYGCKTGCLSQIAHDCLNNYDAVVGALLPETVLFLKNPKVLREMYKLLKNDEKREYGQLAALDILQLLGSEEEDEAFKRISIDWTLQRRLKAKVIDDGEVSVVQRPKIELELLKMFE